MLQEIQVRGELKKGPHKSGGVWIFSGITHLSLDAKKLSLSHCGVTYYLQL